MVVYTSQSVDFPVMSLAENTQDQNLGTDDQNNQDHPLGHLIAYLKRAAEESSKKSP